MVVMKDVCQSIQSRMIAPSPSIELYLKLDDSSSKGARKISHLRPKVLLISLPLSDQDQEPQKCQGIVKTADGQFLYVMLTDYGQNFYLMTVTDSIHRDKKFCDNFKLPQSFLSEIDGSSKDRLNKVKLAVEELLKTGANDVALDGHLDTSIFN